MEWLRNLSSAIDYIENNLDKEISYEEAARIACCSPFYFQRLFSYVSGISLSEYIRRRKMTQAAFELQRTNAKVIDIALKYGYTSPLPSTGPFESSIISHRPLPGKKVRRCMRIRPCIFPSKSQEGRP